MCRATHTALCTSAHTLVRSAILGVRLPVPGGCWLLIFSKLCKKLNSYASQVVCDQKDKDFGSECLLVLFTGLRNSFAYVILMLFWSLS